jgi:tetratricopeptide (TPR) repeat protein
MSLVPETPAASPLPDATSAAPTALPPRVNQFLTRKHLLVAGLVLVALAAAGWRYRITRPDYRLARGHEAVEAGEFKGAEQYAARLEASGQADRAHLLRAESLYARRDPEAALRECNQIKDEGDIRLRAAALSGRCLLDLGAMTEAERVFLFVLGHEPDNVDAHRGLAAITYEMGQWNRALAHLEQVVRLDPADARPHRLMAEINRDMANMPEAVNEYREAIRIRNGLSDLAVDQSRFEMAEALNETARFDESLEVIDAAGPADREPPYMRAIRIEALRGLGRKAEALTLVEAALAESHEAPFYRLRGQLYLDDGNAEKAIPLLEQAAQLSPNHYQSHFLLAKAYAAAGRKADADRLNTRAEQIRKDYTLGYELQRQAIARPKDALVRLRLADLCERTGDAKSAAVWRRAAAQLQGQNP